MGTACDAFTGVMLPLELSCHTSRAITGRTVLFRSLSRLHRLCDGADLRRQQCSFPLFHGAFLLIVAIRNDSNLTKISCGLRLAGDSLQPLHAPWTPAETSAGMHLISHISGWGGGECAPRSSERAFQGQLRLGCAVTRVERTPHGVVVNDSHGKSDTYNHVVIASHSDQALAMLSDADMRERAILGAIGYSPNTVYLHRDVRLMPKRRRAWASWNFLRWQHEGTAKNDVAVTCWMNRPQGLDDDKPLFVSIRSRSISAIAMTAIWL
jgi:hypothetical protein